MRTTRDESTAPDRTPDEPLPRLLAYYLPLVFIAMFVVATIDPVTGVVMLGCFAVMAVVIRLVLRFGS